MEVEWAMGMGEDGDEGGVAIEVRNEDGVGLDMLDAICLDAQPCQTLQRDGKTDIRALLVYTMYRAFSCKGNPHTVLELTWAIILCVQPLLPDLDGAACSLSLPFQRLIDQSPTSAIQFNIREVDQTMFLHCIRPSLQPLLFAHRPSQT